jgi:DNA-binding PucR family transcriptional regulator
MVRASLARVLEDLGGTLLEVVCGDPQRVTGIGGVVIHDAADEQVMPARAVVLGVGVHDAKQLERLLAQVEGRAGAVVVRSPVSAGARVREAAERSGVVLLGLVAGASWVQVTALLRSVLAEDGVPFEEAETLGGFPSGDLFSLANAIAAQLDAPVTIEDRSSRVLAFSGNQDEADEPRVETVLGRQVPQRYARALTDIGVFDELYRSDGPIYVDMTAVSIPTITMSRAAIAVRAGDELLGSIWAAVREPLDAGRRDALVDAAKLVALHLLRVRAGTGVQRRLRAELLSTALEGAPGSQAALERLGLAGTPVVVLALAVPEPSGDAVSIAEETNRENERQRVSDGFAMHLSAMHPRSAVAPVEQVVYGLLPVDRGSADAEERAVRIARDFLARLGDRVPAVIGVGPCARTTAELADARTSATRALRALRAYRPAMRVARLADVYMQAMLLELRDLAAAHGDRPSGPLARLQDYDARHGTSLVATLTAWLDAFGDVRGAAAALHVHPNTFRYRLRRVTEVGGIDLADPEARFAAMLQLCVLNG